MKLIFFIILLLLVGGVQAQMNTPPSYPELAYFPQKNYLKNPGAEQGTTGWTRSAAGVNFIVHTGSHILLTYNRTGTKAFGFDASAGSEWVMSSEWDVRAKNTHQAMARCWFKSTATDYSMQVINTYDDSIVTSATIPASSSEFSSVTLTFEASDNGTVDSGYKIKILSASNAALLSFDDCYLGEEFESGSGGAGGLYAGGQNLIDNNSWEVEDAGWTASGGTYARVATAANIIPPGVGAASWDSDSADQTLGATSVEVTANDGLSLSNGVFSCSFKAASGTATHLIEVYDGSNTLISKTITSRTNGFQRTSANFPFPESGTLTARIKSVAADEPGIYIDDCFFGLADGYNLGEVVAMEDLGALTTTGSWATPTTTYTANYWRRGDWLIGRVKVSVSGAPTAVALSITLPSGLSVNTSKLVYNDANVAQVGDVTIRDSGVANYVGNARQISSTPTVLNIVYLDDAAGGVIETGNVTQAAPMTWASGDAAIINFEVPITSWASAVTAYTPDTLSWRVDATFDSVVNLGTTSQASYVAPNNSAMTLTQNTGSNSVGISCSSTNDNTVGSTTCSAGSEEIGIVFDLPKAGTVNCSTSFSHEVNVAAGTDNVAETFQLVHTANGSQTSTEDGKDIQKSTMQDQGSAAVVTAHPITLAKSTFNFGSSGKKTIRLMHTSSIAGTPTTNRISGSARIVCEYADQAFPAPLLVNSVVNTSTGVTRVETAELNCDAGSAITRQHGAWITSIGNISGGDCAVTITTGTFSATPYCVATYKTASAATNDTFVNLTVASATSVTVKGIGAAIASAAYDFYITCVGSK